MSSFSSISIRFSADLKSFSSSMKNAQRSMQKMGKQMQSVGKNLSIGLTAPVVAFGYKSVQAFDKQAKAIAQVEAGIKSTGMAAGFTSDQLQKMASDLQNKTIFGDEEILKGATSQLLTFTNISGREFARTQEAALNLATRLDGDLKSASIQLGKALNDPIANLSALSRSGIQFSEDQKTVIKSLTETGRLADAQTIILDELEKQYGGAAEAAAKAGTGGLTQFNNIMGDIAEQFGEIIMEYLNPFIAKLKDLALRFQDLDKSTKNIIVVIGALTAAIGPVLLTLGFLMTTVIPGLITAFGALTLPIAAVVAAIAGISYVIYNNWGRIKKEMVNLQNYFIDLYNESVVFRSGVEQIIFAFKTLWNVVKLVFNSIWTVVKDVGKYIVETFKNVGSAVKAALTGDFSALSGIMSDQMALMGKSVGGTLGKIGNEISIFTDNMKEDFNSAIDAVTKNKKISFIKENVDASAIQDAVAEAVSAGMKGGGASSGVHSFVPMDELKEANQEFAALQKLIASTGGNIDVAIQEANVKFVKNQMQEALDDFIDIGDEFSDKFSAFKDNMIDISGAVNNAMQSAIASGAEFIGNFTANLLTGKASIKGALHGILELVAGFMGSLGKAMIAAGVASEAFKNLFASGVGAIVAGTALVALSGVVGSIMKAGPSGSGGGGIPAFADGGMVYGPTLGLMGEYSGVRSNPEIIAPLDKLKGMLVDSVGGTQRVEVFGRLQGQDMLLQNTRAKAYRDRRGF